MGGFWVGHVRHRYHVRRFQLIEKEIRESMIISRIFNPNLVGVWEDLY